MKTARLLRAQLEDSLRSKVLCALFHAPPAAGRWRLPAFRKLTGLPAGLPRGCLTEISGAAGSGRMSFLVSLLAALTNAAGILRGGGWAGRV